MIKEEIENKIVNTIGTNISKSDEEIVNKCREILGSDFESSADFIKEKLKLIRITIENVKAEQLQIFKDLALTEEMEELFGDMIISEEEIEKTVRKYGGDLKQ